MNVPLGELAFQEPLIRFEVQGKERLFAEYIITFISEKNIIFTPVKWEENAKK